jgi:hypothetical protein
MGDKFLLPLWEKEGGAKRRKDEGESAKNLRVPLTLPPTASAPSLSHTGRGR